MNEQKAKAIILTPLAATEPVATQISNILNDLKVTPIFYEHITGQKVKVSPLTEIDKADIVIADVSGANPE